MSQRAQVVADAAVEVVGSRGLRALTHRAVDDAAGLPPGSTSNLHRSRSALVGAVLHRMLELETAAWFALAHGDVQERTDAADGTVPTADSRGDGREDSAQRAADLLLEMLERLATTERHGAMARLALFGETAWDPGVREQLLLARAQVHRWSREVLATVGLRVDQAGIVVVIGTFDHLLSSRLLGQPASEGDREVVLAALRAATG